MGFASGSVSFSRFRIVGGSPKRLDENLLDKLRDHAIGKQKVARSDDVETGWIGSRHILDREFDAEKNIVLDCLYFGLRIDAAKIPPDLMRAYVEMELQALSKNSDGKITVRMKREAREAAKGRAEQEVKAGHYKRMRQFPLLMDTRDDMLFVGATQPAVIERLRPLFKETFGKNLEPVTAGLIARDACEQRGSLRPFETAKPSQFIENAEAAGNGDAGVYWTSHDPASRDWLGNEFLLWLWYTLAEGSDTIKLPDDTDAAVVIAKNMTLECPWAESGKETITCDAPTRLPESRKAIRSGKLPRRMGLIVSRQGDQYELSLQAETFNIGGAALPKPEEDDGELNGRGRFEIRIEQVRHLSATVDMLFAVFLERRLSSKWAAELGEMTQWLRKG